MFAKFAASSSKSVSTPSLELTRTTEFVRAVTGEGYRLAYGALSAAAKLLGENSSGQAPGQRGSSLVKQLPASLQPFVCQKSGKYAPGANAKWPEGSPTIAQLVAMPVIQRTAGDPKDWNACEVIGGAVQVWLDAQEEDVAEEIAEDDGE